MDRRKFSQVGALLLAGVPGLLALRAQALTLAELTQGETVQALARRLSSRHPAMRS